MCRLAAITTSSIPTPMRVLYFNQVMLTANADGQLDGAGLSDGLKVLKSGKPYNRYGMLWLDQLNPNKIWTGHVRAASRSTELGSRAAHPFVFDTKHGPLVCAHNGFIRGMPKERSVFDPDVDSYRAFIMLADIVDGSDGTINAALINEWTAKFGINSQWSFMLMLNDRLHIVRGNREVCYMQLGDGYVLNTSFDVLVGVKEWINRFWNDKPGKVYAIPENRLATFTLGGSEFSIEDIKGTESDESFDAKYYKWENGIGKYLKL